MSCRPGGCSWRIVPSVMLILHATTGIFCLVCAEVVVVLMLHVLGRLDLIMNGSLAERSSSCLVVFN